MLRPTRIRVEWTGASLLMVPLILLASMSLVWVESAAIPWYSWISGSNTSEKKKGKDGEDKMDVDEKKEDKKDKMDVDEEKKEVEKPEEDKKEVEPSFEMLSNPARVMKAQLKVINLENG